MDVLGTIVALGHGDPSSRGLFSGLEAINAALAVTLRESTLHARLSKLKKVHNIYVRKLAWTVDVLGESCRTALTLPELYVPEDIFLLLPFPEGSAGSRFWGNGQPTCARPSRLPTFW